MEATKNGLDWTPIANGYNAAFNSQWLAAHNAGQPGNINLFVDHNIDLTSKFKVGDTVLFRMRLFSDNTNVGWGWAIDDLYIQQKPTGTAETLNSTLSLQAYPNPGNGTFKISFTISETSPVQLSVYDLAGRVAYTQSWPTKAAGHHEENITINAADGIYLLKIKNNEGQALQKIVVRR